MGTRNVTLVYSDGECRVAQYGQWDGYPEGQGAKCMEFIEAMNAEDLWSRFRSQLKRCRWLSEEEMQAYVLRQQAGEHVNEINPYLSRDHGAEILSKIYEAEGDGEILLQDERDFCRDGLMCEFAYVLDLDVGTLEVYVGWNEDPSKLKGRFANEPPIDYADCHYTPVTLAGTWPLTALPSVKEMGIACGLEL